MQKVFAHKHLRHKCLYVQKPFRSTLYYKARTKHVPVLRCTTKLAQSTSQYYYFVLQSLRKARSSTTLYHKACTKHFPVLLCTTKLAQSTFQYYFVLQSLHKARSSTTSYYKACKKHFHVLQSLQKLLPSTTLCYKACTKYFPVLLCTTKLAQTTSQYTTVYCKSLQKVLPSTSHFTQKNARFRAPASSPKQSPCNVHAAIAIRFAASRSKPASLYAHGNTKWQQSCGHMRPLQCDLQSQIQETHWTTHIVRPERPQPQPPHTRGTFHRRLQPLYMEKCKV